MAGQLKKSIYIDALALVHTRKSGVGYTLEQTLLELSRLPRLVDSYKIYLVVPLGKAKYVRKYESANVSIKTIYLPAKVLEIFLRLNVYPPLDWLLGTGVYIFPNYRNWRLWKSRSMTYIYDLSFVKYPEMAHQKNQRYLNRYIHRWINRSDKIITITEQIGHEIEKEFGVSYTNIEVVYCGVDTTVFRQRNDDEISEIKSKYGITFPQYILFVGSIEPRKNLVRLLEAYDALPEDILNKYGLVFVGSGGWLQEDFMVKLQTLHDKGRHILRVSGYVTTEDLPALYSGASLLVFPPVYEGFGIPPLEAMACHTPVAASDIASIREVVQDNVVYFDPEDTRSIRNALQQMLGEGRKENTLVDRAFQRAGQLTWHQSAVTLAKIIEREHAAINTSRPLLGRLKKTYVFLDRALRSLLGDGARSPYRPAKAESKRELQKIVYNDFFDEHPSRWQSISLSIYLGTKHTMIKVLRQLLHKPLPKKEER